MTSRLDSSRLFANGAKSMKSTYSSFILLTVVLTHTHTQSNVDFVLANVKKMPKYISTVAVAIVDNQHCLLRLRLINNLLCQYAVLRSTMSFRCPTLVPTCQMSECVVNTSFSYTHTYNRSLCSVANIELNEYYDYVLPPKKLFFFKCKLE